MTTNAGSKIKAAVTLALITPVLTELFSANMGPAEVIDPLGLLLQFFGYSVPVLFVRELAARARAGLPGLFLMGLAYSIFNEGIIAKTLFFGPPGGGMHAYDAFYFAGIHVVWTVIISTWHALHAMVFPIALVSALFPTVRQERWLSMPVRVTLLVIWVPAVVLGFMKLNAQYADWRYFAAFAAAIAALLWLGAKLPAQTPFLSNDGSGRAAQVGFGMALYVVLVIATFIAADLGAPFVIVSIWPYGLVTVLYFWLRRKRWTTCLPVAFIALGDYGFGSFVNMLLHLDVDPKPVDKIATLAVLSVLFAAITSCALLRSNAANPRTPY